MKTAIAFLTKDRLELTRQSVEPLLQPDKFDLFLCDGSTTEAAEHFLSQANAPGWGKLYVNVRGGAGAAMVFALTVMLNHSNNYEVIGLVENDVLLDPDWYDRTVELFGRGRDDQLAVGAVSARCYQDRILFQRDGYAVCHNLGAGMVMLTREAAQLALKTYRTGWTTDNRRIFAQLAGIDIANFWAFKSSEHWVTADWHWDAMLAAHGFASLALTPSPCSMIGQVPPLAEQGLTLVEGSMHGRIDPANFVTYQNRLRAVREGSLDVGVETTIHHAPETGSWTIFPHQMALLAGQYDGDWSFKEYRGWGTFAWVAGSDKPTVEFNAFGPINVLVGGGKDGGQVHLVDLDAGYEVSPYLEPEGPQGHVLAMAAPARNSYRRMRLTMRSPGTTFYGVQSRERQPLHFGRPFDHSVLPSPV